LLNTQPGDAVYIYARALPAWLIYTAEWRTDRMAVRQLMTVASPFGVAFMNSETSREPTAEELIILRRDLASRNEVYGGASGRHIRPLSPRIWPVNPEWAGREVQRIRAAATTGCVTLFNAHVLGDEREALTQELVRQNAKLRMITSDQAAERFCFSASGKAAP